MCAVSMIYDYGRENPPWDYPKTLQHPYYEPLPDKEARDAIKRFLELLEAAKKFDRSTNQPDCEDPKKADLLKEILTRLDALEKKLGVKNAD